MSRVVSPGAHRARLHSGAEVRRPHADPDGDAAPRLRARQARRAHGAAFWRRAGRAGAHPGHRHRRPLSPPCRMQQPDGAGRPRRLVLGLADRGEDVRRPGSRARRRRQLRRTGSGVPVRARFESVDAGARAGPRREHVEVPDRPHRRDAKPRAADTHGDHRPQRLAPVRRRNGDLDESQLGRAPEPPDPRPASLRSATCAPDRSSAWAAPSARARRWSRRSTPSSAPGERPRNPRSSIQIRRASAPFGSSGALPLGVWRVRAGLSRDRGR